MSTPVSTEKDWQAYNEVSRELGQALRHEEINSAGREALINAYGQALSPATLQGHVFCKPHGYAGDYEIIDRFYTYHTAQEEGLAKWDHYLHSFSAVKAVRNRKTYIKNLLTEKMIETQQKGQFDFLEEELIEKKKKGSFDLMDEEVIKKKKKGSFDLSEEKAIEKKKKGSFDMLNLASGPARDLFEFFQQYPQADLNVDCVDLDANAIRFAQKLLLRHSRKVQFHNKNILRFTPSKQYDLVWSAGLFDYFSDDIFKRLISRFLKFLKPGGELVIGNFCVSNPDIPYMELLDWNLHHRSSEELIQLAKECGVPAYCISIEKEPEAVNLFMRIRRED